jgi:hypothetical protein
VRLNCQGNEFLAEPLNHSRSEESVNSNSAHKMSPFDVHENKRTMIYLFFGLISGSVSKVGLLRTPDGAEKC